ncbi:apolipoprotein C-IV [Perognathus longimembris pacificus]|uniref:apolipoprotein C-IV n=1 Tax=Perognathus longimembris pacificus TaxID=214514 RepID=UPI0020197EB8|nr:apolipoprotein C-IV [Perognathus longimembris pacificus]
MALLSRRFQPGPTLGCSILLLALVLAGLSSANPSPTPAPEGGRWSLVQTRVKELVEPLVTRTKDSWQWFWGPSTLRGFVQTYYEDHLQDVGPRARAWLASSKDSLLDRTRSLCPRLLCGGPS